LFYIALSLATSCPSSSSASLHDALPICIFPGSRITMDEPRVRLLGTDAAVVQSRWHLVGQVTPDGVPSALDDRSVGAEETHPRLDRKSTRLNSSHVSISYAVFCFKKKSK